MIREFTCFISVAFILLVGTSRSPGAGFGYTPSKFTVAIADVKGLSLVDEARSADLQLQVYQVEESAIAVFRLKNISKVSLAYSFENRVFGFRFKLYDDSEIPLPLSSQGSEIYPLDSVSRLGGPQLGELEPGKDLAIQVDLEQYFRIPKRRPAEMFLSLWWYFGFNKSMEMSTTKGVSLWTKLTVR